LQNEKCAVIFDGKLLFILVAVAAADLRVTAGKEMAGNFRKKTLPHTKCGSGKLLFAGRWQEASGVRDRRRTRRIKRRLREGAGSRRLLWPEPCKAVFIFLRRSACGNRLTCSRLAPLF